MAKKQHNIALSEDTYLRLSLVKMGYSFNEYINIMLNYFGATKIDPKSIQEHPSSEVLKTLERIIKIMKAQEKKFDGRFSELKDTTEYISSIFRNVEQINQTSIPLDDLESNGLTLSQLQDINERLAKDAQINEQVKKELEEESKLRIDAIINALNKLNQIKRVQSGAYVFTNDWYALYETLVSNIDKENLIAQALSGFNDPITSQPYKRIVANKRKNEDFFFLSKPLFDGIYSNLISLLCTPR